MSFFNTAFGIHEKALYLASTRSELLASNLANADTPNYKAQDVDFKAVLRRETLSGGVAMGADLDPGKIKYRVPYNPSLDGNTVEADVEQSEFATNAIRYQASLNFINGRIQSLRLAITGGQ
ncbi:MAG: flagellar basal body rod protein FlgB [Pseudomonadota bacterium]